MHRVNSGKKKGQWYQLKVIATKGERGNWRQVILEQLAAKEFALPLSSNSCLKKKQTNSDSHAAVWPLQLDAILNNGHEAIIIHRALLWNENVPFRSCFHIRYNLSVARMQVHSLISEHQRACAVFICVDGSGWKIQTTRGEVRASLYVWSGPSQVLFPVKHKPLFPSFGGRFVMSGGRTSHVCVK